MWIRAQIDDLLWAHPPDFGGSAISHMG